MQPTQHRDEPLDPRLAVALDATPLVGQRTGIGTVVGEVLRSLVGLGSLEVLAFALTWRGRRAVAGALPPGVALVTRPMPARPLLMAWARVDAPRLEAFARRRGTGIDVVHGLNYVVPPSAAARVVTVQDLSALHFRRRSAPWVLRAFELARRAIAAGAFVHVASAFVADELAAVVPVASERLRVVPYGVPMLPVGGDARRVLPPGCKRFVLFVGAAEPRKDLPTLVRAFGIVAARRPELALVLAGPPGSDEDALEAAIRACPAGARVVRTGRVDDAALGALMTGASVLAYPSRYEGFGLPPLQAMAAGTPVVATRAGAVPEVVGDAALLVDPGDVEALADGLARVLDDDELAGSLVRRGTERVAAFRWERCAEGLAALYRDAVRETGGAWRRRLPARSNWAR